MRLTLTRDEIADIIVLLDIEKRQNYKDLSKKIKEQWRKPIKPSKRNATKKATEIKKQLTKDKIVNAVNLMNLEGKKITISSVAKVSGCSYNTVKKHSYLIRIFC
jgi:Fic family protein